MKTLFALACISLTGCAGTTAYLQSHATTIAVVGATAAAVSSTESAVINGIDLKKEISR